MAVFSAARHRRSAEHLLSCASPRCHFSTRVMAGGAQDSNHFKTIYNMPAADLCAKWPLLCEAILLCQFINRAAIFIIPGKDCGDCCTFSTSSGHCSGIFLCSNKTNIKNKQNRHIDVLFIFLPFYPMTAHNLFCS